MSLGKAVVEVGADASGFERDLTKQVDAAATKAQRSLSKLGQGTTQVGKRLTLGVTTPILGIAAASVKASASFQQSMNLLGVNAGIGGAQLTKMGDLAKQMGKDTIFSAGDAADAMLELSKAGFKPAQISGGGVQATMALAATEGLNLADAATITGNAMQAFGLKAKNAAQIADALAAGAVASTASVTSLSEGLGNVGPIARQSGLSLQDTVAALSELDQAGIKGAEGGTALRSFLTRLVPQGKRAKDAMNALGLSFTKSDGSFKSFGQITETLHKKLDGLTASEKAERLQQIFGTYAKQAAAVFLSGGAKAYDKYRTAVEKSGTAQKLSDARMKGTAGAIEQMKGSVDTAALALGDALAPTVVMLAHNIQGLANWFTNLNPAVQHDIAVVGALVAAVGPLLIIGGSLMRTYAGVSKVLTSFSTSMATAEGRSGKLMAATKALAGTGGMLALVDGMRRSSKATSTTSEAMGALETTAGAAAAGFAVGGPLGAGVGALAGGMLSLYQEVKKARGETDHHIASLKTYAGAFDTATAAITRQTAALAYDRLQKNGTIAAAEKLGISERTIVQAALGNVAARQKLAAAITNQNTAEKQTAAMNIANRVLGEARAVDASRLAQLQKNVAIAKTKEEVKKAQAALDKFAQTHATAVVQVNGTTAAIKQVNILSGYIKELTGTTHVISIQKHVTSMGGLLGAGTNAGGTKNWRGGWTWVGEKGPELMRLPHGTQIMSNADSTRAMQKAAAGLYPQIDLGSTFSRYPGATSTPSTSAGSTSKSVALTVVNPVPETTTDSLPRALSTLAFVLGG